MDRRIELNSELKAITDNVYFQPPSNLTLKYPCIVYSLQDGYETYANDYYYSGTDKYDVIVIDRSPTSTIANKIRGSFRSCSIKQRYVADGLYHAKLELYY